MGQGGEFFRHACQVKAEGMVSKRVDAPYGPGDRGGSWLKVKCLNREEFIVVGWTDPEGTRPYLGALLLAYYAPDGHLVYEFPADPNPLQASGHHPALPACARRP